MSRVVWLWLLFAASVHAAPDDLYKQAVQILGGNESVVSKWRDDIRFVVIGGSATAEQVARSVIAEAAAIARLDLAYPTHAVRSARDYVDLVRAAPPRLLSPTCDGNASKPCFNFVVVFTDYPTMRELARAIPIHPYVARFVDTHPDMPCLYAPFHAGRQMIWQALVLIRHDLDDAMRQTCLQEEIYQAFGLFNDYSGSTLFSFNNVVAPKRITDYDKALLAALYDPRVKSGHPANFVAQIFLEYVERALGSPD